MTEHRQKQIDAEMETVYAPFRKIWCEAKACFCMGSVNGSEYNKFKDGITKQEWQDWKARQETEK